MLAHRMIWNFVGHPARQYHIYQQAYMYGVFRLDMYID